MSSAPIFKPKLFTCLRGYSRAAFVRDLIAGITVGVVALPLALAFGIASIPEHVASEAGLSPPAMGLFTAIVAGLIISALGGSRVAIGGPTGAFIVIVYAIADKHGYDGLFMATVLAGVMLIVMGIARMGTLIKFIPYPVTTGFTAGIAVIIGTGQIKDLLGLRGTGPADAIPPEFIGKIQWCAAHMGTINWSAAVLGCATVAALFIWRKCMPPRYPGPIVLLLVATAITHTFHLPVETIADRFGAIPTGLPVPRLPSFDFGALGVLIPAAGTIAMLAAIESLLCCVVADGMLGTRHRSNTELIAQGVANIASPIMGGMPATGAIARTATNVQSGGRTPVAGIVHALVLLAIVMTIGRFAAMVPLCVLAAVLVVVAWNMSEMKHFRWLLKGPPSDTAVLLVTFGLTVFVDLTMAVGMGLVLAAMLFMKRMADIANVQAVGDAAEGNGDVSMGQLASSAQRIPPGVAVYSINGAFFFGAAYKLRETLDQLGDRPKAVVLDVSKVLGLDATGLHALKEIRRSVVGHGGRFILAGIHTQPMIALAERGLLDDLEEHGGLMPDLESALASLREGDQPAHRPKPASGG